MKDFKIPYKIGYTSSYIKDHPFKHVMDLPEEEWDWLNKMFIIVAHGHGKFIALVRQDQNYSYSANRGIK